MRFRHTWLRSEWEIQILDNDTKYKADGDFLNLPVTMMHNDVCNNLHTWHCHCSVLQHCYPYPPMFWHVKSELILFILLSKSHDGFILIPAKHTCTSHSNICLYLGRLRLCDVGGIVNSKVVRDDLPGWLELWSSDPGVRLSPLSLLRENLQTPKQS